MRHYLKIYFLTFSISALCIAFPWLMAYLDFLPELAVLEKYSFLSALIAIVFSCFYVFSHVSKPFPRCLMILLNPAVPYLAVLVWIVYEFSQTTWNGFERLIP